MVSLKTISFLPPAEFAFRLDAGVGERSQVVIDNKGNPENRLERGLVPAWDGTARVGRFELGGGNGMRLAGRVGVLAAVKSVQLVVENAAKLDPQGPRARLQRLAKAQTRALARRFQFDLRG